MRVGRAGSFVDNGAARGILVGVDNKTGCLTTDGSDELGRCYTAHPDSGVVFKGFQLPEWDQLRKLCVELAERMSDVQYIGWDLAYSEHGWVLVEGNSRSEMMLPQIAFKRGIKKAVQSVMEDMDLMF